MPGAFLSRREVAGWLFAFLVVAALIFITTFTSDDPDSALYAALSARLAEGPASRWIAPEWWGHWDSEGLFREHPAGIFLLPAALGAIGLPTEQAAYVVGVGAALGSLLLIAMVVAQITSSSRARLLLVLLQLMPVAFIFRIRANHEYPMLLCLLLMLLGLDRVRRSWPWLLVVVIALTAGMLVKAAFVVLLLLAAALWIAIDPLRAEGPAARPIVAIGAALITMASVAYGYDVWYGRVTGESFWAGYWARQLGPLEIATPFDNATMIVWHGLFYVSRILWHAAPWSVALVAAAWGTRSHWRSAWRGLPDRERRGLLFALAFTGASIALLSPSDRFAERYVFSATYAIAAAGAVFALALWPRMRAHLEYLDGKIIGLPVVVWLFLMTLRLALGPILPRPAFF